MMTIIGTVIGILILLIAILAIYHQIALKKEAAKIIPSGQMTDLGGYQVHVYSEGLGSDTPVLVLLSGSATVAPVYDFKPLYSLLSDEYRIAVAEKAGYGYSDIIDVPRDVAAMTEEVRSALRGAYINPPYILLPHSMSGLEAIYWAQKHPEEVTGIVGLDMATPYSYDGFDFNKVKQIELVGGTAAKLGFFRLPGTYPLQTDALTDVEKEQQRLLMHRNAVNSVYIREGKAIFKNIKTVLDGGGVSCPIFLFSSDGKELGDFWIPAQEKFSKENNAPLEILDCGHYLHYDKSETMAEKIKAFIQGLEEQSACDSVTVPYPLY